METLKLKLEEYLNKVFKELESFHFPELVIEFDPIDVSKSCGKTITNFFLNGYSPKLCAIIIWSMTMNYQIIPRSKNKVKH